MAQATTDYSSRRVIDGPAPEGLPVVPMSRRIRAEDAGARHFGRSTFIETTHWNRGLSMAEAKGNVWLSPPPPPAVLRGMNVVMRPLLSSPLGSRINGVMLLEFKGSSLPGWPSSVSMSWSRSRSSRSPRRSGV